VDDPDAFAIDLGMPAQFLLEPIRRADQRHAEIEVPRGREGAVHDMARRLITAHRVDGYLNHRECR
jgi:hypothetical protein